MQRMKDIPFIVPTRAEQDQIVRFLDWKASKINKLTFIRQKQIDHLTELKQTVISRAVTSGLNPNVVMKSSGVKWIGDIPATWNVSKLKRYAAFIGSGTTPPSQERSLYYDGDINWIQSGDIYGKDLIDFVNTKVTTYALNEISTLKYYKAPYIVIAMYGGSVGNTAISTIDACTNQAVCVIVPNEEVNIKYIYYWMLYCKTDLLSIASGGGQQNISQNKIKNESFLSVPYEEQCQIVAYLDEKCARIDSAITNLRKQIDEISELKSRLISDVVTGKIDVRNIEIPDFALVEEKPNSNDVEAAGEAERTEQEA